MLNQITDDFFKKSLQQIEKDYTKKTDFNNIYQMFVDVSSDIFRQISVYITNNRDSLTKVFFDEQFLILTNLKNYFNDHIKKIAKIYKCVYAGINDNFDFCPNYKKFLEREQIERDRIAANVIV